MNLNFIQYCYNGNKLIEKELETLESEMVKELTKENVEKIAKGERDFRF